MMTCSISTRSSLELMLDAIKQRDEQPVDVPPALPVRPVSRARLPNGRRRLPVRLCTSRSIECHKENEVRNNEGYNADIVPKKNEPLNLKDDAREKPLEKILEIQKSFRGHQVRCYYLQLKRGTITLQSFVRGERARKNFQLLSRRLQAVVVIQRHTKQLVDWKITQKRQRAVVTLQSAVRGWLTRRGINHKEKLRLSETDKEDIRKPGWMKRETTDHIQVSPPALADLQTRLVMVETELGNKEEENAAIRRQLHQYDEKWLEYDKKMKSMEKKWQDQLASLQMSLLAAKNSLANERTRDRLGNFIPISLYSCSNADEIRPNEVQTTCGRTMNDFLYLRKDNDIQVRNNRVDDANLRIDDPIRSSFEDDSRKRPDEEFRNLKIRFEVWKKDYKVQLQEAKTMLQKLGHLETKKSRKKWWGR